MDSGGGVIRSGGGLREICHSEIYHRKFDLARNPPPPLYALVLSISGHLALLGQWGKGGYVWTMSAMPEK